MRNTAAVKGVGRQREQMDDDQKICRRIIFIRHGLTQGNSEKRYIGGRTDEELCEAGIADIRRKIAGGIYPEAEELYLSPMLRCRQTAQLIYPQLTERATVVEDFRECDFGLFEGKNYQEMEHFPAYQEWVDSMGKRGFPGDESAAGFNARCLKAFVYTVQNSVHQNGGAVSDSASVYVVHGGTIMAILSGIAGVQDKNFYSYQCNNATGFICEMTVPVLQTANWQSALYILSVTPIK